jgi:hypothetical protein
VRRRTTTARGGGVAEASAEATLEVFLNPIYESKIVLGSIKNWRTTRQVFKTRPTCSSSPLPPTLRGARSAGRARASSRRSRAPRSPSSSSRPRGSPGGGLPRGPSARAPCSSVQSLGRDEARPSPRRAPLARRRRGRRSRRSRRRAWRARREGPGSARCAARASTPGRGSRTGAARTPPAPCAARRSATASPRSSNSEPCPPPPSAARRQRARLRAVLALLSALLLALFLAVAKDGAWAQIEVPCDRERKTAVCRDRAFARARGFEPIRTDSNRTSNESKTDMSPICRQPDHLVAYNCAAFRAAVERSGAWRCADAGDAAGFFSSRSGESGKSGGKKKTDESDALRAFGLSEASVQWGNQLLCERAPRRDE